MARKTKQKSFLEKNFHYIIIAGVALIVGAVYLNRPGKDAAAQDVPVAKSLRQPLRRGER